ncbi:MAG: gamma-glutamyltransferase family protein, partial [Planctomycetia bacterium]
MSADLPAAGSTAVVPGLTRSTTVALHGMCATSHPLASQAAVDVMKAGGTAVDAAIAANAVLGVVEPMSCGIGGDLFALVWNANEKKLYALNASGRSPYAASKERFQSRGLTLLPETGPLSWSVPGCVDGWRELHGQFGRKAFAELLQPAVELAENGFPVSEVIGRSWRASFDLLAATPEAAAAYLMNGVAPGPGSTASNRRLAATYRTLQTEGPRAFYRGSLADRLVAYSAKVGGLFEARDFLDHSSTWVDPISTTYRGVTVYQPPPNGQGLAVLQILNVMEGYDVRAMGRNSPAFIHNFIEAAKLAFADRAKYYADPEFMTENPVAALASKEYAARRRALIDPMRALTNVDPGDPKLKHGDTIYLT